MKCRRLLLLFSSCFLMLMEKTLQLHAIYLRDDTEYPASVPVCPVAVFVFLLSLFIYSVLTFIFSMSAFIFLMLMPVFLVSVFIFSMSKALFLVLKAVFSLREVFYRMLKAFYLMSGFDYLMLILFQAHFRVFNGLFDCIFLKKLDRFYNNHLMKFT